MNPVTDTLLRRAVLQAASLARENARCVYTDRRHQRATADVVAASGNISFIQQKTINDLPGPDGYPVIGTAPEYFRKPNRGQMHEVQVRHILLEI